VIIVINGIITIIILGDYAATSINVLVACVTMLPFLL
jgi:hypothetical protein